MQWRAPKPEEMEHHSSYLERVVRSLEDYTNEGRKMTDVQATLAERGARYGDFSDHAIIAQAIQDVMRQTPGWARLSPDKKQALTVIADKQARILSGDPEYRDNWHDIQGYAKLAEDRCAPEDRATLPLDLYAHADGSRECRPVEHKKQRQGDEIACSCGKRWSIDETDPESCA